MPEATSPPPIARSMHPGRTTAVQAVSAVALSAAVFLALIAVPRVFGQRVAFEDRLFDNWSLFVCLLFTFWALAVLCTRWTGSRRRARAMAASSLADDADVNGNRLLDDLRVAAQRFGDAMLAERASRAITTFHRSGDAVSTADLLRAEAEAAQAQLDSDYLSVRVFVWAIPLLGLIGTVMGIGQAARNFAILAARGREVEDLRNALVRSTANLGGAFETTMAALLLTVVVMVIMMLMQQRERALLQAADDFCRLRLLPLMLPRRDNEPEKAEDPAIALERLRAENAEAVRRNTELTSALVERLEKLETVQSGGKAPIAVDPVASTPVSHQPQHVPAAYTNGAPAVLSPQYAGEMRASLEELRDSIRAMKPFLDQVAQNLRRQADEAGQPLALRVKVETRPRAAAAAAD